MGHVPPHMSPGQLVLLLDTVRGEPLVASCLACEHCHSGALTLLAGCAVRTDEALLCAAGAGARSTAHAAANGGSAAQTDSGRDGSGHRAASQLGPLKLDDELA